MAVKAKARDVSEAKPKSGSKARSKARAQSQPKPGKDMAPFVLSDDHREALIIAGININAVLDIEAVLGGRASIAARTVPARKDEETSLHAIADAARTLIAAIDSCDALTAGDIDAGVAAERNGEEHVADLAQLYDQLHAVADAAMRAVGDGRRRGALQRGLANAIRGVFREYEIPWSAEYGGPAWTALTIAFAVAGARTDDINLYIQPG